MLITSDTIIYVACPSNVATGGPELLHQLVYKLNLMGLNAQMYYYDWDGGENPVHKEYEIYKNKYTSQILDKSNNILIVPEIITELLYKYRNIQRVIWWLSVDNYYVATNNILYYIKNGKVITAIKIMIKKILFHENKMYYRFDDSDITHFVQSEYAKQHLLQKKINMEKIFFLSDYINSKFFKDDNFCDVQKEDIVVYNPKKGIEFTKKIIEFAKDLNFVPIQNMSRDEVISLLRKAKVYIDFGNHPGKDRIPREAAISGCCILVGKKGAAKYYEDVPIDDEFKFDISKKEIPKITEKIKLCFTNYLNEKKKFEYYRKWIKNEEKMFEECLKKIFKT